MGLNVVVAIPGSAKEVHHYPPGRCPFLRQTTLQFFFIALFIGLMLSLNQFFFSSKMTKRVQIFPFSQVKVEKLTKRVLHLRRRRETWSSLFPHSSHFPKRWNLKVKTHYFYTCIRLFLKQLEPTVLMLLKNLYNKSVFFRGLYFTSKRYIPFLEIILK